MSLSVLICLVLFPHRSQAVQLRLASNLSSSCLRLLNAGQVVGFPHCLNEWTFSVVSNNRCPLELVSRKKLGLQSGHKQTVVWPWLKPFQTGCSLFLKPYRQSLHLQLRFLEESLRSKHIFYSENIRKIHICNFLLPVNRSLWYRRKPTGKVRKEKQIHTFPTLLPAPIKRALWTGRFQRPGLPGYVV